MAYEKKPGDLAVFKNDRKEKDTHPDYTITGLTLDGLPMKGALWLKEDRNGKKFMAGNIAVDQYAIDKNPDAFRGKSSGSMAGGGGGRDYQEPQRQDHRQTGFVDDSDIPFLTW